MINSSLAKRISKFKDESENTCLHIASEYDNKSLVTGLVNNNIIGPNTLNNKGENPLMHCLRWNN